MQCATRPRITELNPHLLCVLCEGYLIDATAITECLHAFCRKCIVQYLETKKYCPVCDVLVHKTKPLQNLKPDKILQSIVYKSVPDLYANEMCNRRQFYANVHPQQKPDNPEMRGEITEASEFITSNDSISLSLEYINFLGDQNYFFVASSSKRYLRCDAAVTVKHLQKLISAKYDLAIKHEIRFFFNGIQLPEHLTLLDIAYISSWKRNEFIRLLYQILEVRKTVIKLEKPEIAPVTTPASTIVKTEDNKVDKLPLDVHNHVNNTSEQAKESKLSTSSEVTVSVAVTATTSLVNSAVKTVDESSSGKPSPEKSEPSPILASSNTYLNSTSVTAKTLTTISSSAPVASKSNENSVLNKIVEKLEKKASTGSNTAAVTTKSDNTATQPSTQINSKENVVGKLTSQTENTTEKSNSSIANVSIISTTATTSLKKKSSPDCPIPMKIPKLLNLDSLKPKTLRVDVCKEVESINAPIMSVNSTTSVTSASLKFIPSNSVTPTVNYTQSNKLSSPPPLRKIPMCYPAARVITSEPSKAVMFPTTTTTSIKKTIAGVKTFTRPWSYTSTPTAVAPVKPTTISDMSKSPNVQKPVKFHKARRNVPRFLGNPSSGIRPLYQGNSSDANSTSDGKSNSSTESTIKKIPKSISLLKVDPKTLAPIASSSVSSKSTNSGANSVKKTFYSSPKLYNAIPDYPCSVTNSPNFVGNLSSASVAGKLSSGSAYPPPPFPNMTHNSLLTSMNPFLCGMYQSHFPPGSSDSPALNGPTSLDYIKAMAAFHPPFPPPLNPLYNPQLHPKLKHDKVKNTSKPKSTSSPPAIQRIAPTSKAPVPEVITSITETSKSSPSSVSSAPSSLSNGVYKCKSKKESSFAINNLIPIDEAKNITHWCSADGVHQVCDQLSTDPRSKKTTELDTKSKKDKGSPKAENNDKESEKNTTS